MSEDTLTAYAAAGALSAAAGIARLTLATDGTFTLANASGLTTDGVSKEISNESTGTHTITGSFVSGNVTYTTMLMPPGSYARLRATGNAAWRVMSLNRVTLF